MKKFEIGKRYYESGVTYEIIKKTAKTVTYKAIQHAEKATKECWNRKQQSCRSGAKKRSFVYVVAQ